MDSWKEPFHGLTITGGSTESMNYIRFGRGSTGSGVTLVFTNIADASAANGRFVIIANDAASRVDYASSTTFPSFSRNYIEFQNLTLTSAVTSDVNIPYVGSAAVTLSGGSFTATPTV